MENDGFFKTRINSFISGKQITFDVYLRINNQNILYVRAGDKIEASKIDQLVLVDPAACFYVKNSDLKVYKQYIHQNISGDQLTAKQKAQMLRESSMTLVEELYEHPDVNKALENSKPIIANFIELMKTEPESMGHLISLSSHDFYTYNHSLDVAIYSLGLAKKIGFEDADLEEMGIGALFHDIGKRQVSLDILCKKGPLDDVEWAQMQKHPQFGLILLNENPTITEAIKAACFEHHESFLGNGYPQQLTGPEIHPFARIVAICDTYDAMTTQRSYNVPLKPLEAVNLIKEKLITRYDPEMVKALHSVMFELKAAS